MKNKVLRIFAIIMIINFFACGTGKENAQTETDDFYLDEATGAVEEEAMYEDVMNRKEMKRNDYDLSDVPDGMPVPDEGDPNFNTEEYDKIVENEFLDAKQNPLSTFSIDVDNAAYSNVRRMLNYNQMPDKGAVRIEEMINYFDYDYPDPTGKHPFTFVTEISNCPWNKENKLIHIGIQGKKLDYKDLKPSNLVFLLDVSGSMEDPNKLPLLRKSFKLLLDELSQEDKVSIVVYAGAAGLVLPPTPASEKKKIIKALDDLQAGGSTAGGEGILLAYKTAKDAFIENGNNRIILATDGDFNVGTSSTSSLVELIEEKRKDDIYLTILGFGMGNYKDSRMEQISNAGNGNYFYIDNIKEAEKVFVKEMRANMFTIAKDVKIQIEFNPAHVKAYRLIGYENRVMAKEDFDDDKKDAGELGAGHTVTAIYEIVPANSNWNVRTADDLKYQTTELNENAKNSKEIMTIKFRYKPPKSDKSIKIEHAITNTLTELKASSDNFRFSAAVAGFGMLLRDSKFKGNVTYKMIKDLANNSKGKDENGYRTEFISLVKTAELLSK
ncbi:MAG: VWA domain-containing protein [Bacteroidales bacterium]|nr:VWA domain-containing protein [Bacteroidales bacterium]